MRIYLSEILMPIVAVAAVSITPSLVSALGINTGTGVGVSTHAGGSATAGSGTNVNSRVRSDVDSDYKTGERRNGHTHPIDNTTADVNLNSTTNADTTDIGKGLDVKANSAANITNPVANPVNGAIGLGTGVNAR